MQKEKTLHADTFTTKPDNMKTTKYRGAPVISDRSKTSKIRSFIDRAHYYPMLIVAPVTSRTNDVKKRCWTAVVKTCRVQNRFKICDVTELDHWLTPQMINKLF